MNKDTIYRQEAIDIAHKSIFDFFDICDDDEESPMTYQDKRLLELNKAITTRIKALPSAEPETPEPEELDFVQPHKKVGVQLEVGQPEIIRCKDCKHYYYADNRIPQEQRYSCDLDGDRWKPEDFCSYAERRTDENNRCG